MEPAPGRWPLYEKIRRAGSAATTASAADWSAALVPEVDDPPVVEMPWLKGQPEVGTLSAFGASRSGCVASVWSLAPGPVMPLHHWSCVASVGVLPWHATSSQR